MSHQVDCSEFEGYWADMASGVVYSSKDGADGSLPREVYHEDAEFARRSALHREVVPLFLQLHALEVQERQLMLRLEKSADQRNQCMEKLRDSHRLTDAA